MSYRGHRPHMGKTAPHPVAGAQVRAMQSAGLAAADSFRQVVLRPEVQIAHLRASASTGALFSAIRFMHCISLDWMQRGKEMGDFPLPF